MIKLPSDWLDLLRIGTQSNAVYLAIINDAGQYFCYYRQMDPAIPLQNLIEDLTQKLTPEVMDTQQALYIYRDMHTEIVEPSDQNWRPLPLIGTDIVSLAQYKAMQGIHGKLETTPPPKPSNAPDPNNV